MMVFFQSILLLVSIFLSTVFCQCKSELSSRTISVENDGNVKEMPIAAGTIITEQSVDLSDSHDQEIIEKITEDHKRPKEYKAKNQKKSELFPLTH